MPKLRHIAIAARDPEGMAEFYKKAFDFREVGRPSGSLADGVFLSDGTLNLAVLAFKTDQLGKGLDYTGIHHFGLLVEDVAEFSKKLEALGAEYYIDRNQQEPNAGYFEKKFYGPEHVLFDIAEHPWAGCAPLDKPGRPAAAKLRHLAIAAREPEAMAAFFKRAFGFVEARRSDGPLAYGVHLSDGTVDLAILRFKTDQLGKGLDYTGLHHFGVLVDDLRRREERVEGLGGRHYMDQSAGRTGGFEVKMYGPEGVLFDIAEHPWTGGADLAAEKEAAAP
jgi:catechol 2,3-dioxygenase-like lactoylglutathione lyase family enzyme